jgi:hypothetical protein
MDAEDIAMICRQTTYTEEEAIAKMKIHGDVVKVLEDFHGIHHKDTSKDKISQSVNQAIYTELRHFMDKCVQPSTVPQS